MHEHLPPETKVTITLARLHQLHEYVLRCLYLSRMAEGGVRQRDGTRRWGLPPEALPYPAATFEEAVDLARAHHCPGCADDGTVPNEGEQRADELPRYLDTHKGQA